MQGSLEIGKAIKTDRLLKSLEGNTALPTP